MIDLLGPTNSVTMTDVMVTIAAFFAGWTKYAQKAKDSQLAAKDDQLADRDKHIAWLQAKLDELRETK